MRVARGRSLSVRLCRGPVLAALALLVATPAEGQQVIPPHQVILWDETPGPDYVLPPGAAFGGSVAAAKASPGYVRVGATEAHGTMALELHEGSWVTVWEQPYNFGPQPFASGHDGESEHLTISFCCMGWFDYYIVRTTAIGSQDIAVSQHAVYSVAKHGDLIAVGQPFRGAGGAVSFFRKIENEWWLERRFDGELFDQAGYSLVVLSPNLALVGLPGRNGQGGEVWIAYTDPTTGSFSPLLAGSGNGERFGHSLATDGDWIAVGAPLHDRLIAGGGVVVDAGAVWLYEWDTFGWTFRSRFRGVTTSGQLGRSLDLRTFAGGAAMLVAGEPGFSDLKGAANVYELQDGTWSSRYRLHAAAGFTVARAGVSLAIASPSRVLVGAPYWGFEQKGAVLAYFVPLFADGFESGDADAWSAVSP